MGKSGCCIRQLILSVPLDLGVEEGFRASGLFPPPGEGGLGEVYSLRTPSPYPSPPSPEGREGKKLLEG